MMRVVTQMWKNLPKLDSNHHPNLQKLIIELPLNSCSTIIDPDDVKRRVKASLARRHQAAERRRVSKKGVAGVVNRKRRENKEDIKTSTSAFWADD